MSGLTSGPRGSRSQSGSAPSRAGFHQTTGSDGVLGVDEAREVPRAVVAAVVVVGQLVTARREADVQAGVDDRHDLGRALVAPRRQRRRDVGEARGARPTRRPARGPACRRRRERRLPAVGPERLTADDELRAVVGRQRAPHGIHLVEERLAGLARGVTVGHHRHGARQVGVLHRRDGAVAVAEVLDRLRRPVVDPAGARRREDGEHPTVEGLGALELGDDGVGDVGDRAVRRCVRHRPGSARWRRGPWPR